MVKALKEVFIILCLVAWTIAIFVNMFNVETFLEVVIAWFAWMFGIMIGTSCLD